MPPKFLGLLAVGVEQEANVLSLLTNTEQCATSLLNLKEATFCRGLRPVSEDEGVLVVELVGG